MANDPKLRILIPALNEFWDAYDWYRERNPQVAEDFKRVFDKGQQLIRSFPTRWGKHLSGTRSYRLFSFPYHLVYTVDENEILIVAVAHTSRRPAYWKDRLTDS